MTINTNIRNSVLLDGYAISLKIDFTPMRYVLLSYGLVHKWNCSCGNATTVIILNIRAP